MTRLLTKHPSWLAGWIGAAAAIFGALTASDTLPYVTALAAQVGGDHAGKVIGTVLAIGGTIVAKRSNAHKAP